MEARPRHPRKDLTPRAMSDRLAPLAGIRRRRFLVASASALAGCAHIHPPAGEAIPILDTHTHFYDPTRPAGVKWPSKDDSLLYRPVLPPEYEALAMPVGIVGTVVVEASPETEDNGWVLDLLPRHRFLRGVIGHLRPADADFLVQWRRWMRNPRFRGIRTGGWDGPLDSARPGFVAHCEQVARDGRVMEVLVQSAGLPHVIALGRAVPSLALVVDHCANVRIDGRRPPDEWLRGMDAMAAVPNVHVKVSGLVEGSGHARGDAPSDVGFYQPVLDALWERFGERRLLFGSNWPVSARFAPLERVVGIVRGYLSGRGDTAARRVLFDNARTLYGA